MTAPTPNKKLPAQGQAPRARATRATSDRHGAARLRRAHAHSRRAFLRGALLGGASLMLPLPRLAMALDDSGDRFRDGSATPGKFGFWFFGNGVDPPQWHPNGPGGVGDAWELTPTLGALQPYKSHLAVLSAFHVKSGGVHVGGMAGVATGAEADERGGAQLPSIDQIMAGLIDDGRPYRTLEVGLSKATPAGPEPMLHAISHSGPQAPNYPEYDPHRLFARLFGLGAIAPELRQARRSVLDTVLADFKGLQGLVGSADRQRLEAHADGIRGLEKRLDGLPGTCAPPMGPGSDVQADDREEAPSTLNAVMADLIAAALACDLTHVYSFAWTLPAAHVYYRHFGEAFHRSFHEDIVHLVDALPDGYGMVDQGTRYAVESLAVHLKALADTPTATGGTLLDDIAMLVTSEVSYGWSHAMNDHPLLVLGKGGGRLRGDTHIVGPAESDGGQANYSRVLWSLANAYGANVDALGLGPCRVTAGVDGLTAG